MRLFGGGAGRDGRGGAKGYIQERERLGLRSVGAFPSAEASSGICGVLRLTGRREGKEREEAGKEKWGSAVQDACQ